MKQEPRSVICIEKQLGWACKLHGAESWDLQGRSNRVSQADGVSDMHQLATSVWGELRQWIMPSARLDARHFSFLLNTTGAFQAATLVLELRGSESE